MKKFITFLLMVALILPPGTAPACTMCQAGATEEYIAAYKITTAILVLIPLTLVSILVLWVYRKSR